MTPDLDAAADEIVAAYPRPAGSLLPLLDLVRAARGPCDAAARDWIAARTGLPPAVVAGVDTRQAAAADGDDVVRVCTGLSCRWMGADEVIAQLEAAGLTVVAVPCLGACAAAPVMARGERLQDGLTPERLDDLLAGERRR